MAARYSSVGTHSVEARLALNREVVIICMNPKVGTGGIGNIPRLQRVFSLATLLRIFQKMLILVVLPTTNSARDRSQRWLLHRCERSLRSGSNGRHQSTCWRGKNSRSVSYLSRHTEVLSGIELHPVLQAYISQNDPGRVQDVQAGRQGLGF